MLVACLTSLVALNGKNHAGTGNSAAFTVTQPLERAQNDAFGPPTLEQQPTMQLRPWSPDESRSPQDQIGVPLLVSTDTGVVKLKPQGVVVNR